LYSVLIPPGLSFFLFCICIDMYVSCIHVVDFQRSKKRTKIYSQQIRIQFVQKIEFALTWLSLHWLQFLSRETSISYARSFLSLIGEVPLRDIISDRSPYRAIVQA
jgi:hypothetical protein